MQRTYPLPGDLIRVTQSQWYALKDGETLRVCEATAWTTPGKEIHVVPRQQASTFWGPSNGPPDGIKRQTMSTSGGPFRTLRLSDYPELHFIDQLVDEFWHWKDFPRAGGGQKCLVLVALWELPVLYDGRPPALQQEA